MNFLEYNPISLYNFWIIFQKIDLFVSGGDKEEDTFGGVLSVISNAQKSQLHLDQPQLGQLLQPPS